MTLRVLVLSNVRIVQEGLQCALAQQAGVDVVSTVDMAHAAERCARLRPDVVLFDAARLDGAAVVKALVAPAPQSKVVAFGVKESEKEILALAAAGTAGYIRASRGRADGGRMCEHAKGDQLPGYAHAAA